MYIAVALFLHIKQWRFHIITVAMEMQQWVQCVVFSYMSAIYIVKMLPQKCNNMFSLYCSWGIKYLHSLQHHSYCNSPITFSSDRRTDRYEAATTFCDYAICTKSITQNLTHHIWTMRKLPMSMLWRVYLVVTAMAWEMGASFWTCDCTCCSSRGRRRVNHRRHYA
jgi:hypothetical protein